MTDNFLETGHSGIEAMLKKHSFSPSAELNFNLTSVWAIHANNITYRVTVPDNGDVSRHQAVSCEKFLEDIANGKIPRIAHIILGKAPHGEYYWTP